MNDQCFTCKKDLSKLTYYNHRYHSKKNGFTERILYGKRILLCHDCNKHYDKLQKLRVRLIEQITGLCYRCNKPKHDFPRCPYCGREYNTLW